MKARVGEVRGTEGRWWRNAGRKAWGRGETRRWKEFEVKHERWLMGKGRGWKWEEKGLTLGWREETRSLREEEADALEEMDWLVRRDGWEGCLEDIESRGRSWWKERRERRLGYKAPRAGRRDERRGTGDERRAWLRRTKFALADVLTSLLSTLCNHIRSSSGSQQPRQPSFSRRRSH